MTYFRILGGTLLVFIGVGALVPALMPYYPGTIAVSYSDAAVPRLLLVAAVGGASLVAGIWVIAAAVNRPKSRIQP